MRLLSPKQVLEVQEFIKQGHSQRYLASKYGVSRMAIRWCIEEDKVRQLKVVKNWKGRNKDKLLTYQRKQHGRVVCKECGRAYKLTP